MGYFDVLNYAGMNIPSTGLSMRILCQENQIQSLKSDDILKHPQSHNTCYIEMHITQKPTLVLVLRISASIVRNNTLCGAFIILIKVLQKIKCAIPSREKI